MENLRMKTAGRESRIEVPKNEGNFNFLKVRKDGKFKMIQIGRMRDTDLQLDSYT